MPLPKTTAAAQEKPSKEVSFSPYQEDMEEEVARATANNDGIVPLFVPHKPVTYDYQPTSEDLQMPRIMLLQGNAAYVLEGNAKAGDWLLPGGYTTQEFDAVVLGMRRSRIRATKPPQGSQERPVMLCSAPDAVQGYGNPGILCAECPYSQWGEKDPRTGKGTPPECRLRYHYLVELQDGDRAELMLNTTTKTSKQAAQAITEGVARYGSGGTFGITMGRKLETSGENRFFVPVVKAIEKLPNKVEEFVSDEEEFAPGFEEEPSK